MIVTTDGTSYTCGTKPTICLSRRYRQRNTVRSEHEIKFNSCFILLVFKNVKNKERCVLKIQRSYLDVC